MRIEKVAENIFQMSDEVWERHANPMSVWTRYPCLPLLTVALWSRAWIGWMSLLPVLVVCFWVWVNPRVFGKPRTTNNWASKAVLGERIWLKHPKEEMPSHHRQAIALLKLLTSSGFFLVVYGLIFLHSWAAIFGTIITTLGKTWFLDRMVWLYQDMKLKRDEYQNWLYQE